MAVLAGFLTRDWRLFALLVVLARLFVRKMSHIQSSIKAGHALSQAEISAVQQEAEAQSRGLRAQAAKEFTDRLIANMKAARRERPAGPTGQDRGKAAEAAIQQLEQLRRSGSKPNASASARSKTKAA